MFKKSTKSKILKNQGLTAIELVVVIAIFGILSSVVLVRFSTFSSGVTLHNLVQEIALRIKQAQNSAILGQYPRLTVSQTPPSSLWIPRYGVYFDTSTPTRFWYFYDADNNGAFNDEITNSLNSCGGVGSECLDMVTITTGETISRICHGTDCSVPKVSLIFERPFPDLLATNNVLVNSVDGPIATPYTNDITLIISPKPETSNFNRNIMITQLGQISVGTGDEIINGSNGNGNGNNGQGSGNIGG